MIHHVKIQSERWDMIKHRECQDWEISKKARWQVQKLLSSYQNQHTHSHVEIIRYMKNIQHFSHRLSSSQERKFLFRARRNQWRESITEKQWNSDQKEWHRKEIQKMTFWKNIELKNESKNQEASVQDSVNKQQIYITTPWRC